jgi:ABC-type antimicrobial peptide transport system permease subunit
MVSSFRDTLRRWSATRLAGDLFISTIVSGSGNEGRLPPDVVLKIRAASGVQRVIPYYETTTSFGGDEVVLGAVDLAAQCARSAYPFLAGSCPILSRGAAGGVANKALASESAARKLGIKVNQEVVIADRNFTIAGIIQEFGTERPLIVIDAESFQGRFPEHYPETITVDLVSGIDPEVVKSDLISVLPMTVKVRNHRELLSLVETLFNRTFRITDSVRWIVFVMALLGVVSTVAQDLWDRRRELKIAAVLGVSHSSLSSAITIEVLAVTVSALLIGIAGGVGIGWCLTNYINPLVFGWSLYFSLSIWPFVEALLFVVSVACVTRLVAGRILKRIACSVSLEDE